jgi:hypothetical protein
METDQIDDDQGFSGLITLSHPSRSGQYSLVCRSLGPLPDKQHTQTRSEDAETGVDPVDQVVGTGNQVVGIADRMLSE